MAGHQGEAGVLVRAPPCEVVDCIGPATQPGVPRSADGAVVAFGRNTVDDSSEHSGAAGQHNPSLPDDSSENG